MHECIFLAGKTSITDVMPGNTNKIQMSIIDFRKDTSPYSYAMGWQLSLEVIQQYSQPSFIRTLLIWNLFRARPIFLSFNDSTCLEVWQTTLVSGLPTMQMKPPYLIIQLHTLTIYYQIMPRGGSRQYLDMSNNSGNFSHDFDNTVNGFLCSLSEWAHYWRFPLDQKP